MKKVAIVINTSWNIFNFRMGLVKALQEKGMEVYAIAPQDDYSEKLVEAGCHFVPVSMDSSGVNPFNEAKVFYRLLKAYKKVKPDVVLHYTIKPNLYGTLVARALGIPSINNVSGLGTVFINHSLVARLARKFYKVAFLFPDKVFFQNNDDQRIFLKFGLVKEKVTEVLPGSGIDTNRFLPNGQLQNEKFTFLVISRLLYDKGLVEFIDAVKQLKEKGINARFQLLGAADPGHRRGIPLETLQAWIDHKYVDYLGTTDDVQSLIHQADCVVLPSYREGTPRTLLEAASSAKPIVTTDVPGCNNVVEDGVNGFLCKVRDAQDLALKMQKMYDLSSEQRLSLGQNSRKIAVNKFDEKIVIQRYLNAIDEVTSED